MQSLQLDPWPWPTAGELLANLDSSEGWTGGEGGEGEKEEGELHPWVVFLGLRAVRGELSAASGGRQRTELIGGSVSARGAKGVESRRLDQGGERKLAVLPIGKKGGRRGELGGEPELGIAMAAVVVVGVVG